MKLAPTPALRAAKARNDKERGFPQAAEAYALTPGGMPERRIAWMEAMKPMFEQYPEDYGSRLFIPFLYWPQRVIQATTASE